MDITEFIKSESDRCVKCGLCLPHCPTYLELRDEGDSPRGRIALMQGLALGQLELSGRLEAHLDRCLACRACEAVCPSGVRYGRLLDAARAVIEPRRRPSRTARLARRFGLDRLIASPIGLRRATALLRLYQRSGLRLLARASGILRALRVARAEALLPEIPARTRRRDFYPARGEPLGSVALFTGCIGAAFDQATLGAAIRILNVCGYGVHVPSDQTCCGALHLHAGDPDRARELAARNLAAFNGLRADAVLFTASGCGAMLTEYLDLPAPGFAAPVVELCRFLAGTKWPAGLTLARRNARVAVHEPCSLRHVLRGSTAPYTLLAGIPGLEVAALPGNARCCGAAGAYMLTQPEMADALRADKLAALQEAGADYLATTNIGCALHLAAGARAAGLAVEIVHPVVLLERQLQVTSCK